MSNTEQMQQWSSPVGQPVEQPIPVEQPVDNARRNRWIAAGVATAVGIGGLVALASCENDSKADGSVGDTPAVDVDIDELRELLTVNNEDLSAVDCETDGLATGTMQVAELPNGDKVVVSKVNSTLLVVTDTRTQDNRLFSDGIANPMTSAEYTDANKEALEAEFAATMCEDPIVASMVANQFANMEVNGVKVVDLNPWLEAYQGSTDEINDNAAELMPAFGKDVSEMSDEEVLAAFEARQEHTELAEKLATLINRFENSGIEDDLTTALNYHVEAGGLTVGQMPEIALNDVQYEGNFLVFQLKLKDGRCLEAFVINPNDQRTGEVDICDVPETPEKTPPTTGTTPPTHTTPTTPPTTGPPSSSTTIPVKKDDGVLPDTGIPADQDPGTPDVPGVGPAGQTPNDEGYIPTETPPPSQAPDTTQLPAPTTSPNTVPATTGVAPSSTNPPVVAPSNPTPEAPETGTLPPRP
jgi:hypothetical protein